jgi:hypothetical protein
MYGEVEAKHSKKQVAFTVDETGESIMVDIV